MIRFLRRARSDERGSNAAEIVMLVPTIALLIGVLVAGGRTVHADNSTQSAAMAAARAASLSETTPQPTPTPKTPPGAR